jgi:hypothetical protein
VRLSNYVDLCCIIGVLWAPAPGLWQDAEKRQWLSQFGLW